MTYIVVFEATALGKARAFDALWSQSRHDGKKSQPKTLFEYYYG